MTLPITFTHEFDFTAKNPDNLIQNETIFISDATGRTIVLEHGLFYTKTVSVFHTHTNRILTLGTDYEFQALEHEITALTGFETASCFVILDPIISGEIKVTYQCIGGREGNFNELLNQLKNAIANIGSSVDWNDVINKPQTFPPNPHTHSVITDLTDLQVVKIALDNLVDAIIGMRRPIGSGFEINDRLDRFLMILAELRRDINKVALLTASITPATEIVKGSIRIATVPEAIKGIVQNAAMTPYNNNKTLFEAIYDLEEYIRVVYLDQYGETKYISDSYTVSYLGNSIISIKAGLAWFKGIRMQVMSDINYTLTNTLPVDIYVDVSHAGLIFDRYVDLKIIDKVFNDPSFIDYTDSNTINHYIVKIASVDNNGNVTNIRPYTEGNLPILSLNKQVIDHNYTLPIGYNGHSVGPVTVVDGINVIIPDDAVWIVN